ncbi:MAG: hypothetical protein COT84_02465 [Chlamydiae bacterium CG10_big_fil_rev_8_21_14_0_10_35_9]|nr:MAG: hypothetical protein COT84_02465 [Chlamydiae bacterium CG10_big_fil_rev_8_21_14_0_10_35_9]
MVNPRVTIVAYKGSPLFVLVANHFPKGIILWFPNASKILDAPIKDDKAEEKVAARRPAKTAGL